MRNDLVNKLENGLGLRWSEPKPTTTSVGPANLRTAAPTQAFWGLWRSEKAALQNLGISPKRFDDGDWLVRWYIRDDVAGDENEQEERDSGYYSGTPTPLDAGRPVALSQPTRVWSPEQENIFSWFANGDGAIVVQARAGTGKTTTIKEAFTKAPEGRILYAVFNKKNQNEAARTISDPRVDIKTLHALGFYFIKQVWGSAKPDDQVETDRIVAVLGKGVPSEVLTQVKKLVGFAKNMLVNPTLEELILLAEDRDIAVAGAGETEAVGNWETDVLADAALKVLELSRTADVSGRISFNDMVWLPVAMGWVRPTYELVVVDEAQDMNLPQLLMAKGACIDGGRICVVGDDRQAIYGFRGAASDGMGMMKETLNAEVLPLTVTYRCPKAVVALAAQLVPDYRAADTAPEGLVDSMNEFELRKAVKVGDAILSRSNAPLMPHCLALIRAGVPARIEGKDIGKALLDIVKKQRAKSVPDFLAKLGKWAAKQKTRAQKTKNAEAKCTEIDDQYDTLLAVSEDAASVSDIERRLNAIFADSETDRRPAVVLSSVHKAKGLEWNRVFLLMDSFRTPKTDGMSDNAIAARQREESNIYYVALTRAKATLTRVFKNN